MGSPVSFTDPRTSTAGMRKLLIAEATSRVSIRAMMPSPAQCFSQAGGPSVQRHSSFCTNQLRCWRTNLEMPSSTDRPYAREDSTRSATDLVGERFAAANDLALIGLGFFGAVP